jgi:hypothetical protein
MSGLRCALFILTIAGPLAYAEEPEKITRLVLPPAGEPAPALKYLLFPDVPQQVPGNAVVHYYRAFSPEWSNWQHQSKTSLQLYDALQEAPSALKKELGWVTTTGIARELELGARSAYCDWQLTERVRSEGMDLLLPDMQGFRQLAVLLAVRARFEMARARFDNAMTSLQTGLKLSHDISQAPLLICSIVGAACAETQLNQIETLMQTPGAPNVYWALTGLPHPFIDLRTALSGEKQFLFAEMPLLAEIETGPFDMEQARKLAAQFEKLLARGGQPGNQIGKAALLAITLQEYPHAKRSLIEQGWKAESLETYPVIQVVCIDLLREFVKARDDMFKWAALPYSEGAPRLHALEQTLRGRYQSLAQAPFLREFMPSLRVVQEAWRVERHIALLRTIEAIRLHAAANKGRPPATLAEIQLVPVPNDPITGKSFIYSTQANQFTLTGPAPQGADATYSLRYDVTLAP